jgi:DNA-binding NarL/FixJ family response regulator
VQIDAAHKDVVVVGARIAVVDPLPMFQQGVAAVLAAEGHTVDSPLDVLAWAGGDQPKVVLLTLAAEVDWDLLTAVHKAASQTMVIALVAEVTERAGLRAMHAGASAVLPRQTTAAELRRAVDAALDGYAVMPAAVAAALTSRVAVPLHCPLSTEHLSWLRRLAAGVTVAQLAGQAGYSEREMFRLLSALYRELGVRTRIQAIVRAQQQGWLAPD